MVVKIREFRITANFNESVFNSEQFTAENVQSSLLTPYSEQGINVAAGLYYSQQISNQGLKFTDFYAHGSGMGYNYGNDSNSLTGPGIYSAAYSILISDISNKNIYVTNLYANFGSAFVNLSSQPSNPDLQGSFNYFLDNASNPTDIMQVDSSGNANFGTFSLDSGIYGPNIMIQTNANATNPMPISVTGPSGTSFVDIKSQYLFIEGAGSVSATFTFGGSFNILSTYLQDIKLTSNFEPSPTFTVQQGSSLRLQTSTDLIKDTNNKTEIIAPNQINLNLISVNSSGYYYTMFTLYSDDSQIISNGESLFNSRVYNIASTVTRNDLNILAGTLLGAGVTAGLNIISIKKLKKE